MEHSEGALAAHHRHDAHAPHAAQEVLARFSGRERRVWMVVALTAAATVVEFVVGALAHSLALTADGWHMASHAGVLGLSGLAYWYARSQAHREQFAFGTGKVYALAGYTNAVVLLVAAVLLVVEASQRFVHAEPVAFGEALPVAVLGFLANVASIALLGGHAAEASGEPAGESGARAAHDHNFRAAYLHVVADTFTGVLAIVALVAGRFWGVALLDPVAGFAGGLAIAWLGVGLLRSSAGPLLDAVPLAAAKQAIRARLEAVGAVDVTDLRLWQTGPGQLGCLVSLVARDPRPVQTYRSAVLGVAPVAHLAVEVTYGASSSSGAAAACSEACSSAL